MGSAHPDSTSRLDHGSTASRPSVASPAMGPHRQAEEARVLTRLIERLGAPATPASARVPGSRVVLLDAPPSLAAFPPSRGAPAPLATMRGNAINDINAAALRAGADAPSPALTWSDPAVLGPFIGKGHFHRAFAIDTITPGGMRQPGAWMALIATEVPSHQEPTMRRWHHALDEHQHARSLCAVAPQLLPAYAGLAAVLPFDQRHQERTLRFATVWQRKDATFQDVVSAGGLAGGAQIRGRPFTAQDVGRSMLLIGRAYQTLHDHDLVYTDPKPANLAFSILPGPAETSRGWPGAAVGAPAAMAPPGASAAGEATPAPLLPAASSMVGDVVFIDAESMQPPGYARDPQRRAVSIMTPPMMAEEVLRGVVLGGGMALKRAQATARNDIFHSALIAFALVTGEVPQLTLGRQRYQQRCDELKRRGGFEAKEAEQVLVDEFRLTRLLDGFDHEQELLSRQVRAARIPQALAQVVGDGLSGKIQTFGDWERRTLASGAPTV